MYIRNTTSIKIRLYSFSKDVIIFIEKHLSASKVDFVQQTQKKKFAGSHQRIS